MKFRMHVPDAPLVATVLTGAGWRYTTGDDWNLWWDHGGSKEALSAESTAHGPTYINHLPGIWALSDKIGLHHCLTAAGNRAGSAHFMWEHLPRTYEMPFDRPALVHAARNAPETIWIAKPARGTRGEGIVLLGSGDDAPASRGWVVQEYLDRPHLLDGRKYTLRLYVLVTSVVPLVAHIYTAGLVKRAAVPFTLDPGSRSSRTMHLTSSAVQRQAAGGPLPPIFLDAYRARLADSGVDWGTLWQSIRRLAAHTIIAARPSLVRDTRRIADRRCHFQLLGFDILIDQAFKPWLLEVNAGPSVRVETPESVAGHDRERDVKARLLEDVFQLTGVRSHAPPRDPAALAEFIEVHRGDFERLVPTNEPAFHDHDWFPLDEDLRLSAALDLDPPRQPHVRLPPTTLFSSDGATVFSEDSHRFLALNEMGAAVAVWNDEGVPRSEQGERLRALSKGALSADRAVPVIDAVLADLWDLGTPSLSRALALSPPSPTRLPIHDAPTYAIGGVSIRVRFDDPLLLRSVMEIFRHVEVEQGPQAAAHLIDVSNADGSVRIAAEPLEATTVELAATAAALHSTMLRLVCFRSSGTIAFPGTVLKGAKGFFALPRHSGAEHGQLIRRLVGDGLFVTASEDVILDDAFRAQPAVVRGVLPDGDERLRSLTPTCMSLEAGPIMALVFPRIGRGQPVMRRIGRRAALERLSAGGFDTLRRFDAAWATELMRWFGTVDRFEVIAPSVSRCAEAIMEWTGES